MNSAKEAGCFWSAQFPQLQGVGGKRATPTFQCLSFPPFFKYVYVNMVMVKEVTSSPRDSLRMLMELTVRCHQKAFLLDRFAAAGTWDEMGRSAQEMEEW